MARHARRLLNVNVNVNLPQPNPPPNWPQPDTCDDAPDAPDWPRLDDRVPGAIAVWGHIAASATRWHGNTTTRGTTVADRAREISTTIDAAAIRTPAPPDAS